MTASTNPRRVSISRFINLYTLLIFVPIALLLRLAKGPDVLLFVASGLAIVPLAKLIGDNTEVIAEKVGPTLGGLINATLGNAPELIITVFALSAGYLELVKASIIGSILGNLLLVLGFSYLMGGLKHGTQKFNRQTASTTATLVILAFIALAIPSAFDDVLLHSNGGPNRELFFSEGIAVLMIILYALYILFSIRTPKVSTEHDLEEAATALHVPKSPMSQAVILLALAAVGVALMSETLVGTVEPVGKSMGLSEFFIGIIIVPLIGNVAEHIVAIQVALKNRMDLSLGISLGSSLQIALFVAPVLVFISLLFSKHLLLVFSPYELLALAAASFSAALVSQDGESNWLEGTMLLAVYSIFALAFFLLPAAG